MRPALHDGHGQLVKRPDSSARDYVERLVSYRTEVTLAYNLLPPERRTSPEGEHLATEHHWVLRELERLRPDICWFTMKASQLVPRQEELF